MRADGFLPITGESEFERGRQWSGFQCDNGIPGNIEMQMLRIPLEAQRQSGDIGHWWNYNKVS